MLTPTHHLAGLAASLAVAAQVRPGPIPVVLMMVASTATAGGPLSPDVDQRGLWHVADRLLPDEWLGHGGPMRHRGLSHWWGIPAAAAVWLWLARETIPGPLWWLAAGVVLGWVTHLAGDLMVGAGSPWRDSGIPVGPWFWHVGFGFRCGGFVEDAGRWIVLPALIVWQAAALAGWVT
jgi:membrane-bound metal-dependent hydrolase YbcI (DUF457 family)